MVPAHDDMFEDEFEDEPFDEGDDSFEEFEEDFEAAGPGEIREKVVSGMDTFCMVWSFFATATAIVLLSWLVLYDVYDDRVGGVMPPKEIPIKQSKIEVVGFGRDAAISDVYNYAVLKVGTAYDVTPGTVIYIGNPSAGAPDREDEAWVKLIVTEQCEPTICRAMIVDVRPPAMGGGSGGGESEPIGVQPPGGLGTVYDRQANRWEQIDNATEAAEKLPLLFDMAANGKLLAATARWSEQEVIRDTEEDFADHVRVPPGS